ncbi:hydroxyethylthiazole kinase [Thermodesulfobium sp.]|jgi:hydroxyethylthiazole kinase|uniref:Hydroxyethylthiazole kinase n=1 Tax=Thermodesulfobium narugense TaxID=184064 RepID=A0A7C5PDS3_9BACT
MLDYLWIKEILDVIKERKPLIHHLTNYVVMNDSANITLAIGALPIMAQEEAELDDITNMASAVLLNIGTLKQDEINQMLLAGKYANLKNIPLILDPVGAGASKFRTRTAKNLLHNLKIDVIKGNSFEISTLCDLPAEGIGVDAVSTNRNYTNIAKEAAERYNSVVLLTGEKDIVSDGKRIFEIEGGSFLMSKVTGCGCMLGSIVASFVAVKKEDILNATLGASIFFKSVGNIAEQKSSLPGSFRNNLIDSTYLIANGAEKLNATWRERDDLIC